MRKYIFHLTTIAIIMLFGACSNEVLINDNGNELSPAKEGFISLTATMPGDPVTRVALTQEENLDMKLTWEEGDVLQLVFVQGDTKTKKTATVNKILDEGKKAQFDIELPEGITGNFDLYGVYGGGGLSNDNPTLAKLPTNAGNAGSLASVKDRKDVMLYFASKDMEVASPYASVIFKHVGSLFSITFKNTSAANVDGLKEARILGVGGDGKWAYNSGAGGNSYDLVTGKFLNTETAGNFISFNLTNNSLEAGKSKTFWSWYPLLDKMWPELKLELRMPNDAVAATSINTKPAKTAALTAGMVYYINAEWDGAKLSFKSNVEPHIFVKTTGLATNDGSSWATATTLSKALEMMEEGDEIHIAAGTYMPTKKITGGDKDRDFTFEVNKNVTLIGGYPADATNGAVANKSNLTILSGDKKFYHTVTVTAPVVSGKKVIIKNLSMIDGLAGVAAEGTITVNGVVFDRSYGGGLSIGKSVVDFMDCKISDNISERYAGGIHIHNGAIASFINTDIVNNKTINASGNAGGVWNAASTMYLNGCNVTDNSSAGVGGGIYNHDGTNQSKLYVYNSTIARNKMTGSGGGGIYTREGSYLQIVNSTIYKNVSDNGSGVTVYATGPGVKSTSADIINTTIYDNNANNTTSTAGGLRTTANTTVKIYNSIISGNTAPTDANFVFAANTVTLSYVVLGELVFDGSGGTISGQTFDPETMISKTPVKGTFMITAASPAATKGMNVSLLQTLASTFTPPIASDIITKDQLGVSRSGNTAMGAVTVKTTSEPGSTVQADMLDVIFNVDGSATDVSPMNNTVAAIVNESAKFTVAYNTTYKRNVVTFNPEENGVNGKAASGYSVNYQDNVAFKNKLAEGHSFETLVKFDVDYTSVLPTYETKFFSTHGSGGTGFLITGGSRGNGLTFLPNVPAADGGGSNWIWGGNSMVKPDGSSWYHLVGVWDKTAGKVFIYVNGEKKAEGDAVGFYRPADLNPLWLTIGGDPGNYPEIQNPFKGSLTIARIYSKALTEADAVALWNAAK